MIFSLKFSKNDPLWWLVPERRMHRLQIYSKVIFCTNYALFYFFKMFSCDNAVCFDIFDDWNLFELITDEFLTFFCTWDWNARRMLIYHRILLFSPCLVKNKLWLHFKSFLFSFLKEGELNAKTEQKWLHKIDIYFWILIKNVWFQSKIFQIFCFLMSDDVTLWYIKIIALRRSGYSNTSLSFHQSSTSHVKRQCHRNIK